MAKSTPDNSVARAPTGSADAPGVGNTRQLLRAVFEFGPPEHFRLLDEVEVALIDACDRMAAHRPELAPGFPT